MLRLAELVYCLASLRLDAPDFPAACRHVWMNGGAVWEDIQKETERGEEGESKASSVTSCHEGQGAGRQQSETDTGGKREREGRCGYGPPSNL